MISNRTENNSYRSSNQQLTNVNFRKIRGLKNTNLEEQLFGEGSTAPLKSELIEDSLNRLENRIEFVGQFRQKIESQFFLLNNNIQNTTRIGSYADKDHEITEYSLNDDLENWIEKLKIEKYKDDDLATQIFNSKTVLINKYALTEEDVLLENVEYEKIVKKFEIILKMVTITDTTSWPFIVYYLSLCRLEKDSFLYMLNHHHLKIANSKLFSFILSSFEVLNYNQLVNISALIIKIIDSNLQPEFLSVLLNILKISHPSKRENTRSLISQIDPLSLNDLYFQMDERSYYTIMNSKEFSVLLGSRERHLLGMILSTKNPRNQHRVLEGAKQLIVESYLTYGEMEKGSLTEKQKDSVFEILMSMNKDCIPQSSIIFLQKSMSKNSDLGSFLSRIISGIDSQNYEDLIFIIKTTLDDQREEFITQGAKFIRKTVMGVNLVLLKCSKMLSSQNKIIGVLLQFLEGGLYLCYKHHLQDFRGVFILINKLAAKLITLYSDNYQQALYSYWYLTISSHYLISMVYEVSTDVALYLVQNIENRQKVLTLEDIEKGDYGQNISEGKQEIRLLGVDDKIQILGGYLHHENIEFVDKVYREFNLAPIKEILNSSFSIEIQKLIFSPSAQNINALMKFTDTVEVLLLHSPLISFNYSLISDTVDLFLKLAQPSLFIGVMTLIGRVLMGICNYRLSQQN